MDNNGAAETSTVATGRSGDIDSGSRVVETAIVAAVASERQRQQTTGADPTYLSRDEQRDPS